jgi:hypothetical protein
MAVQWTTSSAAAADHGVKVLVYGRSGRGKTVLCATAPRPVILSAESGLLSLNRPNLEKLFGVGNPAITYDIPVMQINTVADLTEAHAYLSRSAEARQHFSTICLDSSTEIAEQVLANAKLQVNDKRQAYGELIDKMMMTVKQFRDIPGFNVCMTAKEEMTKNETGVTLSGPMMPGSKVGPGLPYYFDEVFHLDVGTTATGQKYRFLQTDGDLQYEAKDRSGRLDLIERPDLTYIFNKIRGGSNA